MNNRQNREALTFYDQREAEQQKVLASLRLTASPSTVRRISRMFAREQRQMALRRQLLIPRVKQEK